MCCACRGLCDPSVAVYCACRGLCDLSVAVSVVLVGGCVGGRHDVHSPEVL